MVKKIKRNLTDYFKCEECGLWYKDKAIAERCQEWCAEHKSCNLDIIKYSMKIDEDKDSCNDR